jgi:hypothetical protein
MKELLNWNASSVYILSFEYNSHNNPFDLTLYEPEAGAQYKNIFTRKLQSQDWTTFEQIVGPGGADSSRILHLTKGEIPNQAGNQEILSETNKIDMRKLSLKQIPHPKIVLRKEKDTQSKNVPSITYTEVNPTKFIIDVKNATSPYVLNLLDAYSPRWKLYLDESGTQYDDAPQKYEEYSLRNVIENVPLNRVFYREMLNAPSNNVVADVTHFKSNGYANAWYIRPEDVVGKSEYRLVAEMVTQRRFYISSIVTFVGILILIVLTINSLARRMSSRK